MKNKVALLIFFFLAIGLCFGGWWLLTRPEETPAADTLWSLQDITAITVTDEEGYTIPLAKGAEGWYHTGEPEFPLDQSYAENMAAALAAPAIDRVLTDGLDLAGWGLETPWATVTVQAGSATQTLRFGSKNPVTDQYYATVEGRDGLVYMLASGVGSPFSYSMNQMAALPDPFGKLDSTSIYDIQITSATGLVHLWDDNAGGWNILCREQGLEQTKADAAGPDEIVSDAGYLYYNQLVSWKASQELALFGLDAPDLTVQFKGWSIDDPDITMVVRFHLKRMPDSEDWYMWEEGSESICTVYNYLVNRIVPTAADYLPAAQ